MAVATRRGEDPVLFAEHQLDRGLHVGQLQQARQRQGLDQQREVGPAVRGVLDEVHQVGLGGTVGRAADRQRGDASRERQTENAGSQQARGQQHGPAAEELRDGLELHRRPLAPPAGRGDPGQGAGAAASLQFERHPAAQGVADDVGGVPAEFVELTLDVIGQQFAVQEPGPGLGPAVMAGHGRGEHLEAAGVGEFRADRRPDLL